MAPPVLHVVKKRFDDADYDIETPEIAHGAVWRVYKAKRNSDDLYVAIKETLRANINSDLDILRRCVGNENVVQLLNVAADTTDSKSRNFQYLITELCSTDLATFLRDVGGRFCRAENLKNAARQLTNGYRYLFENRILHKNISSKNILVRLMGKKATLKISGFNCAVFVNNETVKKSLPITGRLQYMAPEIGTLFVKGHRKTNAYDFKCDLWSLGVLFYEIAEGKFPLLNSALLDFFTRFGSSSGNKCVSDSIHFDSVDTIPIDFQCLVLSLLRPSATDRPHPTEFFDDAFFQRIPISDNSIIIDEQQENEAVRNYDLTWTLQAQSEPKMVRIGEYEFDENRKTDLLGKGVFGEVRKAKRLADCNFVALKRIHEDDVDAAEIETMQTVTHPNLLKLLDNFRIYPYLYIVTELCACDLETFVKMNFPSGKLRNETDARILAKHISSGYMAMRSADILHRDIKPSNVLVVLDGASARRASFKLADFGCSKKLTLNEYAQTVLGTPFYMAPELGACLYLKIETAHYDHRADVWSMGLILFQSMLGRLPFSESDLLRLFYDVGVKASTTKYQDDLRKETESSGLSEIFSDLLSKSLQADYTTRLTAADFFQHDFHVRIPVSSRLEF